MDYKNKYDLQAWIYAFLLQQENIKVVFYDLTKNASMVYLDVEIEKYISQFDTLLKVVFTDMLDVNKPFCQLEKESNFYTNIYSGLWD